MCACVSEREIYIYIERERRMGVERRDIERRMEIEKREGLWRVMRETVREPGRQVRRCKGEKESERERERERVKVWACVCVFSCSICINCKLPAWQLMFTG